MTTIEALDKIAELLASESAWCKLRLAEDREGNAVPVCDTNACKWCLTGAMFRTFRKAGDPYYYWCEALIVQSVPLVYHGSLQDYNDASGTTHADILRVIAKAREIAAKEEKK